MGSKAFMQCSTAAAALVVAGLTVSSGVAQAALHARAGGMVYDDVFNVTWLADMNHAFTSGYAAANATPAEYVWTDGYWVDGWYDEYGSWLDGFYVSGFGSYQVPLSPDVVMEDGSMGWSAAKRWAENLTFGGSSEWRLPTLVPGSCSWVFYPPVDNSWPQEYGCPDGELSHLFEADLYDGAKFTGTENRLLFKNLQPNPSAYSEGAYWSGTEDIDDPAKAWLFIGGGHEQFQTYAQKYGAAFAMAVHVGDIAAVPEPQTYAQLVAGLAVLLAVARRRSR